MDWTNKETYLQSPVDFIMATDVIYNGSNYDKMVEFLDYMHSLNEKVKVLIMLPKQRDHGPKFLDLM